MTKVLLYSTPWCPYCVRAKEVFNSKGVDFRDVDISSDTSARAEMMELSGRRTVPQIWINDHHIGGCDDLLMLEVEGKLDSLLGL